VFHRFSRLKRLKLAIDPLAANLRPFLHRIPVMKLMAAYICLVAGTVGLAVPVLPGIPILLLGLKLLGPDHPLTRGVKRLFRRS
jgi:uncharacterized RDD family membrane protein YckC